MIIIKVENINNKRRCKELDNHDRLIKSQNWSYSWLKNDDER